MAQNYGGGDAALNTVGSHPSISAPGDSEPQGRSARSFHILFSVVRLLTPVTLGSGLRLVDMRIFGAFFFLADFFKGKKQIPKKLMWQQASTLIVKNVDFPFGFYSDLVKESNAKPEEGEDDRHARQGRGLLPNSAFKVRGVLGMIWILYLCVLREAVKPLCLGRERWGCKVYARQCYLFGEAESSTLSCCTGVKETPVRWGLSTVGHPDSGHPFFFFLECKKRPAPAAAKPRVRKVPHILGSNSRRGCTCSQATLLWSLYGRMSTRRGEKMSTFFGADINVDQTAATKTQILLQDGQLWTSDSGLVGKNLDSKEKQLWDGKKNTSYFSIESWLFFVFFGILKLIMM